MRHFTKFVTLVVCSIVSSLAGLGDLKASECPGGEFQSTLSDQCLPPADYEDINAFEEPMSFTMRQISIRAETTWIAAEGVITEDTPVKFKRFLENNIVYKENIIEFNSPGGNLYAAIELGRIIQTMGNPTTIGRSITLNNPEFSMDVVSFQDAVCLSACAYAFFGGEKRYFDEDAVLGVHQFGSRRYGISLQEAQIASSDIAQYLEEMGIDQRVFQIAARTSFENAIFVFDSELAKELNIIYDPSDRSIRFEVSLLNEHVVANLKIYHQGYAYDARLHCIDGFPRLVIWQDKSMFPQLYHNLKNAVARFYSQKKEFFVKAESGLLSDGTAFITFSGWELPEHLLKNGEITFGMIYPAEWDSFELFEKIMWADAGTWFSFHLLAENAPSTIPIVMRECRR